MIPSAVAIILSILSSSCVARNTLLNDEELKAGQSLEVGSFKFIMQSEDCNLVLYNSTTPIWSSNTYSPGKFGCRAVLEKHGELLIFDRNDKKVWSSQSYRNKGRFVLVLQEDGNVVIYGVAVWATGTWLGGAGVVLTAMNGTVDAGFAKENATTALEGAGAAARNTLLTGEELKEGESLQEGPFKFIMLETGCNLALSHYNGIIWASTTAPLPRNGCRAVLMDNGNLMIYDKDNYPVWSSNTNERQGHYVLVLQKDRNVVTYGPEVWSTGTYATGAGGVVFTALNATLHDGFANQNNATVAAA